MSSILFLGCAEIFLVFSIVFHASTAKKLGGKAQKIDAKHFVNDAERYLVINV